MTLDDYANKALSFRLPTANHEYAVLGLSGEVGELHSLLAKSIRDGQPISFNLLRKEIGDILWFVAALSVDFGFTLEEVAAANIEKLESRSIRNALMGSGDER